LANIRNIPPRERVHVRRVQSARFTPLLEGYTWIFLLFLSVVSSARYRSRNQSGQVVSTFENRTHRPGRRKIVALPERVDQSGRAMACSLPTTMDYISFCHYSARCLLMSVLDEFLQKVGKLYPSPLAAAPQYM
jgi:hypothetical protein